MSAISYKGITLDRKAVEVTVSGSRISEVREIPFDSELPRILPPLVDLQHNGALGHAFNRLAGDAGTALRTIGTHLLRNGVCRVLATFPTAPYENLMRAAEAIGNVLDDDAELNKLFCGIFHEGVFISPDAGWRGGHKVEYIMPPDWEKFSSLNRISGNRVKMVNVAPEVEGCMKFIEKASENGILVALGHCHPDSETIHQAADRGARVVTHFANGAAPDIHRFKNPFWGFLADERLSLGLVGDGFHLPKEVTQVAVKVKGASNCFMVSDANIFSGCKPGVYQRVGGMDCQIEANGFIHVVDSEILAGAWFQNNRSADYLVNVCGMDFETAWCMCSTVPAKIAGIEVPALAKGEEASFVIARGTEILKTVFCGKEYAPSDETL